MKRRTFIKTAAVVTASSVVVPSFLFASSKPSAFDLPDLQYNYDALEPYIDAKTMQIHHTKHHQAYINNLNQEISKNPKLTGLDLESINRNISSFNTAVRNNGGGHFNHSLFWKLLSPANKKGKPSEKLLSAIKKNFGSLEKMQAALNKEALNCFGSGWGWLIETDGGKLTVCSTPNQDNPLMDISPILGRPLIAIDVWEHAYYLKYQNRRAEYLENFWSVINWNFVNSNFLQN